MLAPHRSKTWWFTAPIAIAVALGSSCDKRDAATAHDGSLVTPYLAVGEGLAEDSVEGLGELGAQVIHAAAGKQDQPGVAELVRGASGVGAPDIQTARTAFKLMSEGMITAMKADPSQQSGHMIVHCTMTFGGEGATWVQKEGSIMNPYEGTRMLHCGDKVGWTDPVPGR
jgi:Cu(I)/Ag(I) efflux system membrane fusion protein